MKSSSHIGLTISAPTDRRRRVLAASTIVSTILHALVLGALFAMVSTVIVPKGSREIVSQVTISSIERVQKETPVVRREIPKTVVAPPASAPARVLHELSKNVPNAVSQPPKPVRKHETVQTQIDRDQAQFSKEVATLNKSNDAHAIPTIDPASQASTMKTYSFEAGDEHGNGYITPTKGWRESGLDCYYGRYEFTYPNGSQEAGAIAWPFCYPPGADPFKQPPHPMPFPPPLEGYKLPPGTYLPPLEKEFYENWVSGGA